MRKFLGLILAVVIFAVGCGSSGGNLILTPDNSSLVGFLFASNVTDGTISSFQINTETGSLTQVPNSPFDSAVGAQRTLGRMVLHPSSRFLYGIDNAAARIYALAHNQNGQLAALAGFPITARTGGGQALTSVATDVTGNLLYVCDPDEIDGYRIDQQTGALTPLPGFPINAGTGNLNVFVEPGNRFLLVADGAGNGVGVFELNPNSGALTAAAGSPVAIPGQPSVIGMDSSNRFLYVASQNNTIRGFTLNRGTGALTALPGFPVNGGFGAVNRLVFFGAQMLLGGTAGLDSFQVGADGALTQVAGFPVATPNVSAVLATATRFLYTIDNGNNVRGVSVQANGATVVIPNSPFTAGNGTVDLQSVVYTQ